VDKILIFSSGGGNWNPQQVYQPDPNLLLGGPTPQYLQNLMEPHKKLTGPTLRIKSRESDIIQTSLLKLMFSIFFVFVFFVALLQVPTP